MTWKSIISVFNANNKQVPAQYLWVGQCSEEYVVFHCCFFSCVVRLTPRGMSVYMLWGWCPGGREWYLAQIVPLDVCSGNSAKCSQLLHNKWADPHYQSRNSNMLEGSKYACIQCMPAQSPVGISKWSSASNRLPAIEPCVSFGDLHVVWRVSCVPWHRMPLPRPGVI